MPGAGIEPAHPQGVRDFKSLASTYSATQAKRKTVKSSNTSEKSLTSENGGVDARRLLAFSIDRAVGPCLYGMGPSWSLAPLPVDLK